MRQSPHAPESLLVGASPEGVASAKEGLVAGEDVTNAGGPASAGGPAEVTPPDRETLSVTRLAISSGEGEEESESPRPLLAGIETLDFGVYVEFDRTWPRVVSQLEKLKRAAKGTPGKIIAQGRCAMLPGGKPNYPFQVQFAEFQLWLSSKQVPERETPNVFISLGARLLWESGVRQAVEKALASLVELTDGTVRSCRMSRCDLTADFYWPQGLTDEFLRRYAVMRSRSTKLYLKDDQIESFYVGASDADIKLKIYHKSLEIVRSGKDWFHELWNLKVSTGVWRFEFQVRRDLLRSLDINSVDDLLAKAADLWRYLTTEWFSLRLLDDPNATRRTVHPWWETVQACDEQFGTVSGPCQRRQRQAGAQIEPLVRQIAGHFVGLPPEPGCELSKT